VYILAEADYSATNWYKRILSPLKVQARRKRVQLCECESVASLPVGEACAFVMGGSEGWMRETVCALQERGCHPILLNEIDEGRLSGRYSRVRSDYRGLMERLAVGSRCALYGMNPASVSDTARRAAFLDAHPMGEIFENNASLRGCFEQFWERHCHAPFDSVICTNDFAAVSLLTYLREKGAEESVRITAQQMGNILSYFPSIRTVGVDPTALAAAAFEIADCMSAHPDFIGVSVAVGFLSDGEDCGTQDSARTPRVGEPLKAENAFYGDPELAELLSIERLLSSADETDLNILHLLAAGCRDIAEEAFLSDNGVKYRIKKMKQLCAVESKREIPVLLEKYGIQINVSI